MNPSMETMLSHEVEESESYDSDCSSQSDSSTSVAHVERGKERARQFIQGEEYRVRRARSILCLATLLCSVAVSVSVYASAVQYEYRSLEKGFEQSSKDLMTNLANAMNRNLHATKELSAHVTSNAEMTGSFFPLVTFSQYSRFSAFGSDGLLASVFAPLVHSNERAQWETYSTQSAWWLNSLRDDASAPTANVSGIIFHWKDGISVPEDVTNDPTKLYAPFWQSSPPQLSSINNNLLADPDVAELYDIMTASNQAVLSGTSRIGHVFDFALNKSNSYHYSVFAEPVYNSLFGSNQTIAGMVLSLISYDHLLEFSSPESVAGLVCVISDRCGKNITYQLFHDNVTLLGYGDLHDQTFDDRFQRFGPLKVYETAHEGLCQHQVHVYPSSEYQQKYLTQKPAIYTFCVILSFVTMAFLILLYEHTVTQRYEKTMDSALRTGALIASLFPENVRDRLLNERVQEDATRARKVTFEDENESTQQASLPIADFFANTTVMFADIAGFTAWSSTREPFQVFELLETIYGAFDKIAKRRRVFKVETVGDCYVAVCGIPTPRPDHAIAMAKFARHCLELMTTLTKTLEIKLGPDTADLAFRIGLHSGPVTGGVIRGDNARFQLFGDTVNTAARMESTGVPNKIHFSQSTADLLIDASKGHWILPRDELVTAKGKGQMKTYWLTITKMNKASSQSDSSQKLSISDEEIIDPLEKIQFGMDEKTQRLVDWNKDILMRYLKLIVARREKLGLEDHCEDWSQMEFSTSVIDEVAEILPLPQSSTIEGIDVDGISINLDIEQQLYDFVVSIARMYRSNPFHNFDHASHVTMSIVKLLSRIVPCTGDILVENEMVREHNELAKAITSDPLTPFACVFAALIHDADHEGVSNAQLIKEKSPIALAYNEKSVAEQKSLVLAWDLLMTPKFDALRKTLCVTVDEAKQFRQILVNCVMATDIMAPDLKELRHRRWQTAFSMTPVKENESDTINRKATIVIEHLIQASDVCHTMQHWHVYRKWNESLFLEMSKAYAEGRAENNPAETWYKGEIGFFDFYIIPLAKKLAECKVFGVSSDEFLSYAIKNRDEWEARGEDIVREMEERLKMSPCSFSS